MEISRFTNNTDNNFNLIRFLAAFLVLYSHSYPLFGFNFMGPVEQFFGKSWGSFAVHIFFITSGFLIMGSFKRNDNTMSFILSRILRIYPGLIVSIFVCVFVFGIINTTVGYKIYLKDQSIWDFLYYNSLLVVGDIRYGLIGVFKNSPYPNAVNGSLWTLPHEVKMYLYLFFSAKTITFLSKKQIKKNFFLNISILFV